MLVSHRHDFIYTKTSRTASTSVEVFFEPFCVPEGTWSFSHAREERVTEAGIVGYRGPSGDDATWRNHMAAAEIRDRLGADVWDSYFKFCVMRNPFDKAVSEFYFNRNRARNSDSVMRRTIEYARRQLRSRSARFLKQDFAWWLRQGGPYVDRHNYVIDGEICMDDFIFFECLEDGLKRICERLDLPYDDRLPQLKSGSRDKKYSTGDHYTSRSVEIVAGAFEREIESFGYEFPKQEREATPSMDAPSSSQFG